jgi:hypothetical protein
VILVKHFDICATETLPVPVVLIVRAEARCTQLLVKAIIQALFSGNSAINREKTLCQLLDEYGWQSNSLFEVRRMLHSSLVLFVARTAHNSMLGLMVCRLCSATI